MSAQILKFAQYLSTKYFLHKLAVSEVFDLLGSGRTADTIAKKVQSFLQANPEIKKSDFQTLVAEMAEKKFNQLVTPYLKVPPVKVLDSGFRKTIQEQRNQDDLQFFLHDLLHEIITPGSTKRFSELDEQFEENQSATLEDMKNEREFRHYWEEDPEGNEYFSADPRYELSQEVYSLDDFIEEQVAEAITNKNKISNNGLEKYVKTTLIGLMNQIWEESYSQEAWEFHPTFRWNPVVQYFAEIDKKVRSDVAQVRNPKYQVLAKKFYQSFSRWLSELQDNLRKKFEENDEINLDDLVHPLLSKTKQWIGANFNVREQKFQIFDKDKVEFEPNEFGEKPIQDLTDDFKMSLARRWLLAVDQEVERMILQAELS